MTVRELPPAEWSRVEGLDLWPLLQRLDPARVSVLAVEDGITLAGVWAFVWMPHAEGVWIHPAYRSKTSVARKLWTAMKDLASRLGVEWLVTGACDPVVTKLLEHHGATKVLADTYVLPLTKGST